MRRVIVTPNGEMISGLQIIYLDNINNNNYYHFTNSPICKGYPGITLAEKGGGGVSEILTFSNSQEIK